MKTLIFVLTIIAFSISCNTQTGKISISKEPVYSETDTQNIANAGKPFAKSEYFLVSGDIENRKQLVELIDSFAKKRGPIDTCCVNYVLNFYEESSTLNKEVVDGIKQNQRYKIFQYTKETNHIVSYTYLEPKILEMINWGPKYSDQKDY